MVLIIKKKHLRNTIVVILILICIVAVYSCIHKQKLQSKESSLFQLAYANKLYNTTVESFVSQQQESLNRQAYAEVFDISKGEVVKKVEASSSIQEEVRNYLKEITGMVTKVKAFPDKGYIIKVPLMPPADVDNQYLSGQVSEVFVIFSEQGEPYLLILDNKGRPEFFNFNGNTDKLLSLLV